MKSIFLIISLIFSSIAIAGNVPVRIKVLSSGSYTVPARKFAKISVNVEGTGYVTINSQIALRATQNTVIGSTALKAQRQSVTYFTGFGQGTTNNTVLLSGVGNTVSDGLQNLPFDAFNSTTDQKVISAQFDAPTGTIISGSGVFRAIITLYDI